MGNSHIKGFNKQDEGFSFRNGELILRQLIASFDGKSLPLRVFSNKELDDATNGFDESRFIKRDSLWTLYKGSHDGRFISVKLFNTSLIDKAKVLEKIINEVAIASQMGKHKNILKLLGYCAESELPLLVYEYAENGDLSQYISRDSELPLPWESRLRILNEVANAVSFLHYGTSRVVVQGDIKPYNIFLDDKFSAKLGDFVLSKLIPLGEDHIREDIVAETYGYMAPESATGARFSEKSDVFGLGVVILQVLTARRVVDLYDPENWIPRSMNEFFSAAHIAGGGSMQQQIEECAELVRRCFMRNPEERPTMIEVAKSLRMIRRLSKQRSENCTG
ncbi:non-functional pseudokinase ZED1-like [Punica granatum]|uniref:Protein kinase domain-containing protein n=2 Tax=Punica granatum TaxID=22663 RepID=A0A218WQ84_PUNGR|nr:non-functional pseudokinase ZED1-like [Punica granatum]OWM74796.1 hypothetical protein CDL15_Pgr004563 [Punica granatum]PKI38754.1 hypothetical protein CRG98_040867 [Punica granatum]